MENERISYARIGLLLLGVGGAMLFALLYNLISNVGAIYNSGMLVFPAFTMLSFFGFIILGLGFWLLVQSGKPKF
jgi:hypothetical protein